MLESKSFHCRSCCASYAGALLVTALLAARKPSEVPGARVPHSWLQSTAVMGAERTPGPSSRSRGQPVLPVLLSFVSDGFS